MEFLFDLLLNMDYLYYALIATIILALVLYKERRYIKVYAGLGLFTMLLAFIFENIMVYLGHWTFYAEPMLLNSSLLTIVLYFHYACFCYFIGNVIIRRSSHD